MRILPIGNATCGLGERHVEHRPHVAGACRSAAYAWRATGGFQARGREQLLYLRRVHLHAKRLALQHRLRQDDQRASLVRQQQPREKVSGNLQAAAATTFRPAGLPPCTRSHWSERQPTCAAAPASGPLKPDFAASLK